MPYQWVSIFSKIGLLDQPKPCTQIYLKKHRKLHKFATSNNTFKKMDYYRHALSYRVHGYQFPAKSGYLVNQNRAHNFI